MRTCIHPRQAFLLATLAARHLVRHKTKSSATKTRSPHRARLPTFYDAVYTVVACVPRGQLVAYGWVAAWLGSPRAARAVGYAMAAVGAESVPWQRVVNAQGGISIGGQLWRPERQRELLLDEGVRFRDDGTARLSEFGFAPTKPQLRRWLRLGESIRKAAAL